MTLDFSGDYVVFDGRQTVTLGQRQSAGDVVNVSVEGAWRETAKEGELEVMRPGMALGSETTHWHLPTATLGLAVPERFDTITDATGLVWVILAISHESLIGFYRCACVKQRSS